MEKRKRSQKHLAEKESMLGGDVDLEIGGLRSHGCGGKLQRNNGGRERKRERKRSERGGREGEAYLWGQWRRIRLERWRWRCRVSFYFINIFPRFL